MSRTFIKFIIIDKDTDDKTVIQCDKKGFPMIPKARRRNHHEMLKVMKKYNEAQITKNGNRSLKNESSPSKQVIDDLFEIENELFYELNFSWLNFFNIEDSWISNAVNPLLSK